MSYMLIDRPVSYYSTEQEVLDWITELEKMPPSNERDIELKEVNELLTEIQKSS